MALSPQQITQLAYNAGFRGSALRVAVAVALAESSGNPRAYNPETAAGTRPGSGSRGLWQIYGQAHPEYNSDAVYDPQLNAKAAYAVYREAGNSFRPWSTYNNGSAYTIAQTLNIDTSSQTLSRNAPLLVSAIGGGLASTGGGAITSPQMLTQMTDVAAGTNPTRGGLINVQLLPEPITQAISSPEFPKTVAIGALGLILLIAGLTMLIIQLSAPVVKPVGEIAVKAATKGIL